MNKKTLVPLIIILFALGIAFFFIRRISKPGPIPEIPVQPITVSALQEEIRVIYELSCRGQISQEKADVRLTALEDKLAAMITRHGLQAEVDEFVSQHKAAEELGKWAELRIMAIELQLAGVAQADAGLAGPLWEEIFELGNKIYTGQISQQEAEEKLSVFENKLAELIIQHGIEAEVNEFVARYATIRELMQWADPRIRAVELQLGAIAEYFVQKYRIDTGEEVKQVRALQIELLGLSDDIWEGRANRKEIDEKLFAFESKTAELIAEHGLQEKVDEYAARAEAALDRLAAISPRINAIQLQLSALELYLQ